MRIAVFGLNFDQVPYVQEAKALGLQVIGFDKQENPPGRSLCNQFYQIGYDEIDKLYFVLKQVSFSKNDRLFTAASQSAHLTLATLAPEFGIAYPSLTSVKTVISKFLLYPFLQKNSVPIPLTLYIKDPQALSTLPENAFADSNYLKSDCSKNPNYVLKGSRAELLAQEIPWERDRFLDEGYVLQPEFFGKHFRFNLLGDKFEVYEFHSSIPISSDNYETMFSRIASRLSLVARELGMEAWLLKFDIVLAESSYVVLDIGIDPPSRFISRLRSAQIPAEAIYLRHYLGIDQESLLDEFS